MGDQTNYKWIPENDFREWGQVAYDDRMNCAPEFVYPWLLDAVGTPFEGNSFPDYFRPLPEWPAEASTASQQRKMFRLPYLDIQKLACTPSPFINAGHKDNPNAPRRRLSSAGFPIPCTLLPQRKIIRSNRYTRGLHPKIQHHLIL
jgi:hypothetical protein